MRTFYYHTPCQHDERGHSLPCVRITYAGIYIPELKVLSIGASRCSERDNFSKKRGRTKAFCRADSTPLVVRIDIPPEVAKDRFFSEVQYWGKYLDKHSETVVGVPVSLMVITSSL